MINVCLAKRWVQLVQYFNGFFMAPHPSGRIQLFMQRGKRDEGATIKSKSGQIQLWHMAEKGTQKAGRKKNKGQQK